MVRPRPPQRAGNNPLPDRDRRYLYGSIAALTALLAAGPWLPLPPGGRPAQLAVLAVWVGLVLNALHWRLPIFPYDRILSAASTDGLNWTREEGVRLDVGGRHDSCQVYSPWVVAMSGYLRLYFRAGGYDSLIASATSRDGLSWQEEEGIRIGGGAAGLRRVDSPRVLAEPQGGWVMYCAGTDGPYWRLYRSESAGGLDWSTPALCLDLAAYGDAAHALQPSVVRMPGGGLRLFFTRSTPALDAFYTTSSADGKVWEPPVACQGYRREGYVVRHAHAWSLGTGGLRVYFSEYRRESIVGAYIASALTEDGINWRREEGVRLASGGPFDRHGVFCPQLVPVAGGWRMYYGGYWGRHLLEPYTLLCHRRAGDGRAAVP